MILLPLNRFRAISSKNQYFILLRRDFDAPCIAECILTLGFLSLLFEPVLTLIFQSSLILSDSLGTFN